MRNRENRIFFFSEDAFNSLQAGMNFERHGELIDISDCKYNAYSLYLYAKKQGIGVMEWHTLFILYGFQINLLT